LQIVLSNWIFSKSRNTNYWTRSVQLIILRLPWTWSGKNG